MTIHLICVNIIFSSVSVAVWPLATFGEIAAYSVDNIFSFVY